jgi:periplasmic protein TonB
MPQRGFQGASPNAHLLIGEMPAPRTFERRPWEGTGLSIAAHAVVLGILIYATTHVSQVVQTASSLTDRFKLVFFDRPGEGGGGGGGGAATTDPSRKAEITATRPRDTRAILSPVDTPEVPATNIPVAMEQAIQTLPGAIAQMDATSPGSGTGPGGGGGRGPGSGGGDGPGLGVGRLGGFGEEAFHPGNGVTSPELIKDVKPRYTVDAMRAKLQGVVQMEAVVLPDGSVDPNRIRITRSLDSALGLDQEAMIAVKQWRFRAGTYRGQPVSVRITVELTFTLR